MKDLFHKVKFQSLEPLSIEDGDIYSELVEKRGSSLFLGKYSIEEINSVLRKRSFYKEAQKRGLFPVQFDLDSSEFPPLQRFRIFFKTAQPENLVVDLRIKESLYRLGEQAGSGSIRFLGFPQREYKFLTLEWLTLQHPHKQFSEKRYPLPGQEHPGLGLGRKVFHLFTYLARINRDEGILAFPAYYHNALLFARSFRFVNPEKEGEILAIKSALSKVSFHEMAWIVHLNCLKDGRNRTYEWKAEEQVYPMDKDLKNYFDSVRYKKMARQALRELTFTVDWECFQKKFESRTFP